jgi:acyl transferase domain-containing protein
MLSGLYNDEAVFRGEVDRCSKLLEPNLGLDLRSVLYPSSVESDKAALQLNETWLTQPAMFVIEYALAKLWNSWGVTAQAMIGHSIGEYAAACLSGVFSLEDALWLVSERGRLIQDLPPGAMLAVPLPSNEVEPSLNGAVDLAAVNAPAQCVVSGPEDAILNLEAKFANESVACRRLRTSHAFHSRMVEPIAKAFLAIVTKAKLKRPTIPFISNVTGTWITAEDAVDPSYWVEHMRRTVRFSDGLCELLKQRDRVMLEVGPGDSLCRLVKRHQGNASAQEAIASISQPGEQDQDQASLMFATGKLWASGVNIDWQKMYSAERGVRVELPAYPFERQRYWIEERKAESAPKTVAADNRPLPHGLVIASTDVAPSLYPRPQLETAFISPRNELEKIIAETWQTTLGIDRVGIDDRFFDLGGDSLLALQVVANLKSRFNIEVPVVNLYERLTIRSLAAAHSIENKSEEGNGQGAAREIRALRRKGYQQKQRSKRENAKGASAD